MECGCVASCCGICVHACTAKRPRLDRTNAAQWAPPDLNKLRGEKHKEAREADSGVVMLWFWQMTGERYDHAEHQRARERKAKTRYEVVKQSWDRLSAPPEQKAVETQARYERASDAQWRSSALGQKELQEQREAAAERATQQRELCVLLRHCGLERLANDSAINLMRDRGIQPSLHEVPSAITRAECKRWQASMYLRERSVAPSTGLLDAITCFLNRQHGAAIAGIDVTLEEAERLHRAIALYRFQRFMEAALQTHEHVCADIRPPVEQLFQIVYEAVKQTSLASWTSLRMQALVTARTPTLPAAGGSPPAPPLIWLQDMDVAEWIGAIWMAGESVDGRSLHDLFQHSALSDAADYLLACARDHHCMRVVLIETLQRCHHPYRPCRINVGVRGFGQMVKLLINPRVGTSDQHVDSLFWFLGQLEYTCRGRLWSRVDATGSFEAELTDAISPRYLCELARAAPNRVAALVKVLKHSIILREPVRLFLDADVTGRRLKAYPVLDKHSRLSHMMREWALTGGAPDAIMRSICTVLLPAAINDPTCFDGPICDALLIALQRIESGDATFVALQGIFKASRWLPCEHVCSSGSSRDPCTQSAESMCRLVRDEYMKSDEPRQISWDGFVQRMAAGPTQPIPTLQVLCVDALRGHSMARLDNNPCESASIPQTYLWMPRPDGWLAVLPSELGTNGEWVRQQPAETKVALTLEDVTRKPDDLRSTEYHVGQFRATTVFFRYPTMRAVICIGQERPRLMTQARMAVCNTGKDGHVYVITSYYTGEDGHV